MRDSYITRSLPQQEAKIYSSIGQFSNKRSKCLSRSKTDGPAGCYCSIVSSEITCKVDQSTSKFVENVI